MKRAVLHSMAEEIGIYNGPHGRLAYRRRRGEGPGLVWFGGYAADMTGTKATFLDSVAERWSRAYLRFDYSGHGASEGAFEAGTISAWAKDALAVFDALTEGPQVLIGSSMGAWIATLVALQRPDRLAGAVFIAPAPDFTEDLFLNRLTQAERERLHADGRVVLDGPDATPPSVFTRSFIEDGRLNLVLRAPIPIDRPVRILQGMKDADVPFQHAIRFAEAIQSPDLVLEMSKSGDHRLSTPADLDRLERAVRSVA